MLDHPVEVGVVVAGHGTGLALGGNHILLERGGGVAGGLVASAKNDQQFSSIVKTNCRIICFNCFFLIFFVEAGQLGGLGVTGQTIGISGFHPAQRSKASTLFFKLATTLFGT